jgi:hypothetical protein
MLEITARWQGIKKESLLMAASRANEKTESSSLKKVR